MSSCSVCKSSQLRYDFTVAFKGTFENPFLFFHGPMWILHSLVSSLPHTGRSEPLDCRRHECSRGCVHRSRWSQAFVHASFHPSEAKSQRPFFSESVCFSLRVAKHGERQRNSVQNSGHCLGLPSLATHAAECREQQICFRISNFLHSKASKRRSLP